MKRIAVLALVLALGACSSSRHDSDTPETYEPYYDVRDHGTIQVDPPNSKNLQYAAYCQHEGRFLSNWSGERSQANSDASDHRSKSEWHRVTVLWRQPRLPEGIRIEVPNHGAHEDLTDDIPVRPRQSILNRKGY